MPETIWLGWGFTWFPLYHDPQPNDGRTFKIIYRKQLLITTKHVFSAWAAEKTGSHLTVPSKPARKVPHRPWSLPWRRPHPGPQWAADRFQCLCSSLMNCRRLSLSFFKAEYFLMFLWHIEELNLSRTVSIRWNQTEHFHSVFVPQVCVTNKKSTSSLLQISIL